MVERRKTKMKKISLGCKLAIGIVISIAVLGGCRGTPDQQPEPAPQPVAPKPAAPKPLPLKGEVTIDKPVISPAAVSPGGTIRQELKYSLSAERIGKLKVLEVIVVTGKDLKMELSRKETEKVQDDQVSTFQFKVPKGLPPGDYQLITTISAGKKSKSATGSFRVK